jgi:MFS family permease
MKHFATSGSIGATETFVVLGVGYFIFMIAGALGYRVSPENWKPAGWTPDTTKKELVTRHEVHLDVASRTPQFWLTWLVLMLNVSAGIGILSLASPLLQEVFGGRLIGVDATYDQLNTAQLARIATLAAAFTGLLSLFNIVGRIFWASLSDKIGRKGTYMVFFLLGIVLYSSIPWTAATGSLTFFVLFFGIILSMYGGGFATIPAYLSDLFGTKMVGAIHGRLLTAWSVAGVAGPAIVDAIADMRQRAGHTGPSMYTFSFSIMIALLAVGFLANELVRAVNPKFHEPEKAVRSESDPVPAKNA